MTDTEVEAFLAGQRDGPVAMFRTYRDLVLAAGDDIDERVHRTEVAWARKRTFTSAFFLADRLELAIDLLRPIQHPRLLMSFPTTQKVVTSRLSITAIDQVDDALVALIDEAYATVGPGTR
ncbi:MAG: DUF5655 domain-containing protein [Mycetocola sp.]